MKIEKPSGNQVAFLILAGWLLMVPLTRWLERALALSPAASAILDRYLTVIGPALVFLAIAPVRRACVEAVRKPIGPHRAEVAVVTLLHPLHFFAFAGALAAWWAISGGAPGLQAHLAQLDSGAHAMAAALDRVEIASQLLLVVMLGPIVEELLFRRFLYKAWEARYGWIPAMLASATLFAILHAHFLAAFVAALVFTCIYRRTGSLRAAIVVHAAGNLLAMYPLLGRFVWPRDLADPGNLGNWTWHLAALAVVLVLVPLYAGMSRDRAGEPIVLEDSYVALPR